MRNALGFPLSGLGKKALACRVPVAFRSGIQTFTTGCLGRVVIFVAQLKRIAWDEEYPIATDQNTFN
jgi:hypothetical protein